MARQRSVHLVAVPAIVLFALAATLAVGFLRFGGVSALTRLEAPVQDFLMSSRNALLPGARRQISPDVALIGIGDSTYQKLGAYGRGTWATRQPFLDQLPLFRSTNLRPTVLAYDILFRELADEASLAAPRLSADPARLHALAQPLAAISGANQELNDATLQDLMRVVIEQGNLKLCLGFDGLRYDGGAGTAVLLGYFYAEPPGRQFARSAILGHDATALSEEHGTQVPYLRDLRLPRECAGELPTEFPFYSSAELPTNEFLDYVRLGFINVGRDPDGTVRRAPLVFGLRYTFADPATGATVTREFFLPSLALLACLYHWGIDLADVNAREAFFTDGRPLIELAPGRHLTIHRPEGGDVRVPIDRQGRLYLDFPGTITDFAGVPFHEVAPTVAVQERLHRKIVFVGLTATGSTDTGAVPVDPHTPFVFVHMVAASNLLTQTFLLPLGPLGQAGLYGLLALVLAGLGTWLTPHRFGAATSLLALAYMGLVFALLAGHRYLLPLVGPLLFLGLAVLGVVMYYYLTEAREKRKIRGMFSTMVSGEVLQYMEDRPETFSLAGERREATMFFSDVQGFTSISESLPADRLVELLNRYLSPMTDIVLKYQGYVDKYEGDLIMAEWGVPYPVAEHARLACYSALEQQEVLAQLRPALQRDFGHLLYVRMGLNSGVVSAGNMGSARRFSYTVMGDAVNLANRLEPTNKDYGTFICLGENTYDLAKDHIEARLLDRIVVQGKQKFVRIYELLARKGKLDAKMAEVVQLYERGLQLYAERQWDAAITAFSAALMIQEDAPSRTLRERTKQYRTTPPPPTWQSEYIRKGKD